MAGKDDFRVVVGNEKACYNLAHPSPAGQRERRRARVKAEKFCTKCATDKPLSSYNKNRHNKGGLQTYCRNCMGLYNKKRRPFIRESHRLEMQRHRKNNPEKTYQSARKWKNKHPGAHNAHVAVYRALLKGELIKPSRCELCNIGGHIHAHHNDYSNPLDVQWVCSICHKVLHLKPKEVASHE